MPCTVKKTLKSINEKKGYYIVGVKGNQKNLLKSIKLISESTKNRIGALRQVEKSRGRIEERKYELFKNTDKELKSQWAGFKLIIKVHRIRKVKGKISEEIVFYITNKIAGIKELSTGIRNHWLIENSLHWVKDVTFAEDSSKYKDNKLSIIKSILVNIAINILRKNEIRYLKSTMRLYCHDIKKLLSIIE